MQTREEKNAWRRTYYQKNKEKCTAQHDLYRSRNADRLKAHMVMRKYHLTIDEYDALIAGGCFCGEKENLHIDHDHQCCPGEFTCGKCIRGVSCRPHNIGDGFFKTVDELLGLLSYRLRYEDATLQRREDLEKSCQ